MGPALYYASFYAVIALLLTEGRSSSKHSGVRALLDREWMKPGRLPVEFGRLYRRLFESRQRSDYADFVTFGVSAVSPWVEGGGFSSALIEAPAGSFHKDTLSGARTCGTWLQR